MTEIVDDPVFKQAVAKFRSGLTKMQMEAFAECTRDDIIKTVQRIQDRHGSQRRLRNMRRLSKFVEGMSQLGRVVEVFLNVSNAVAFVWGPIKFILVTASTWIESLDVLLDTYGQIGDVLPSLSQYSELYKKYPSIQKHLGSYYCDILEFHRSSLEVFSRPGWKTLFGSAWKTFKTQFGPILNNLKRHREILSDEKLTAVMKEVQDIGQSTAEKLDRLSNEMNAQQEKDIERELVAQQEHPHQQLHFVVSKLDAPDYQNDHDYASEQRLHESSGDWILNHPLFQDWIDVTTPAGKLIYLSGIPGAGKTILTSRVIDHLKHHQQERKSLGQPFSIVYFYFKYLQREKRTLVDMLVAIICQLVNQDRSLLDHVFQECCSIDQQKIRSRNKICELALTALESRGRSFIVLDGLDECAGDTGTGISREADEMSDFTAYEERSFQTNGTSSRIGQLKLVLLSTF